MQTAEEARYRARTTSTKETENQLNAVSLLIDMHSSNGQFYFDYPEYLSNEAVIVLRQKGYQVTAYGSIDPSIPPYYRISWE